EYYIETCLEFRRVPLRSIFTKRTQRALISGLQIEEKKEYPNTVVDGIWGPTTMNRCPTLQQYGTVTNKQYVYLLQYALYANGFEIGRAVCRYRVVLRGCA